MTQVRNFHSTKKWSKTLLPHRWFDGWSSKKQTLMQLINRMLWPALFLDVDWDYTTTIVVKWNKSHWHHLPIWRESLHEGVELFVKCQLLDVPLECWIDFQSRFLAAANLLFDFQIMSPPHSLSIPFNFTPTEKVAFISMISKAILFRLGSAVFSPDWRLFCITCDGCGSMKLSRWFISFSIAARATSTTSKNEWVRNLCTSCRS